MNFQHLEYFNELAETRYMAQAAEKLGISQPTLSYAVKKLEEELGVPLLEREGRNIRLTVYGKVFKEYSEAGVQQIHEGGGSCLRWPWAKAASCQSGWLKSWPINSLPM
ncbi:Cyn operon transcriptional activator [Lactobacillus delbrueckii subsp. delbrueckii]|uniref:Cyn operon transcriptional activator n=1 Tax=Lactobacillus delbrueckii subsp. delbrueckii TaxID=83684 RepID=A0AAU9R5P8_9LACO|nr:LysR family transcriptional regulator [Lactobacillus delbrueckii]MCT4391239.1 LysR family transcriptional regulator [Lactobacillus delbrueckii]CAH1706343.1 Cyn operon transcriptional activator [Lactobacillus delbrueckii subsp. delbrueckii]